VTALLAPGLLASALLAAGCSGPEETTTELRLPTEAEAQAEADARITRENAEAEFEALLEEIETEG
jgi:uncharacterized lipoprotein YmbA